MMNFTTWIRKNIGIIISIIGITLLVILTFGDIGELLTDEYWKNVGGNISSIGALTIGLVLIQTSIKQGISEQALSVGLNTPQTTSKYDEHKKLIKETQGKHIYLPYFLSLRNSRETKRRKQEFLIDNNFTSEKMLYASKKKKVIRAYNKIQTNITADSIKWSTTEIVYNKNGRIEKLETYRKKRLVKGIIAGFIFMIGTTLITGGLFLDTAQIPIWQKIIKLFTYLIVIAISVVFDIGKNYEKGAFGVPNELEEINSIWEEFAMWEVPSWVKDEVSKNEQKVNNDGSVKDEIVLELIDKGDADEKETNIDSGTVIQEESNEEQSV